MSLLKRGSPWQNGSLESFNGKLRDDCLGRNFFTLSMSRGR